jgi:sortase (surface protein transpeptidase)
MTEVEIYHAYFSQKPKKRRKKPSLSGFIYFLSKVFAVLGVSLILISFFPSVWYLIKSGGMEAISSLIQMTAKEAITTEKPKEVDTYQPKMDLTLPLDNRLRIPSVKVDTVIHEAVLTNYEAALKKGVWRVADFGTPESRGKPTILAAHRYGYLSWTVPYRLKNSFYNLPKLKKGATVEIVWKQRKYVYEIYKEEKGETITDYSADLILYTCESLKTPVRIFKYGRLLRL